MPRRSILRLLDAAAVVAVLAILAGWLLKTPVAAAGWARRDLNDYTLNLRHSREVDATHRHPFGFTYPPPSVLLRLGLGQLGFEAGGGLWIALGGVSLLAALAAVHHLLGRFRAPGWGLLALVALLLVKHPFEFEFKYLNANALFLALVLGSVATLDRRPRTASLLLSLSIALKLYSAVFLPWLLLTRRLRTLGWTLGFSAAWFVFLPAFVWGWSGTWEITASWWQRAQETGTREFPIRFASSAYLVSLHAAVLATVERTAVHDPPGTALLITRAVQAGWAAAVLLTLTMHRARTPAAVLIDATLLLLLPLPLSGQLQPHHAVVLLPAAALLLATAADRARPGSLRFLCGFALVGASILMEFGPHRPWLGFSINAAIFLYFLGLAAIKIGGRGAVELGHAVSRG